VEYEGSGVSDVYRGAIGGGTHGKDSLQAGRLGRIEVVVAGDFGKPFIFNKGNIDQYDF
jgi:hypothetical protein